MKLYVKDQSGKKLLIRAVAKDKRELARQLGGLSFRVNGHNFTVRDVVAEKSAENAGIGMVVGGLIGALGGPSGVLAGGVIGALAGIDKDQKETVEVGVFNGSDL
jgi:hypothetical protein